MLSRLGENDDDERTHIFATMAVITRIIMSRRQFLDLIKNEQKKKKNT
jgi:hypothetical protein